MSVDTPSMYLARQTRLVDLLKDAGLDALILNPGPSLVYLTGLHFHLMERPVVVLFTPEHSPVIVLPELEKAKVESLPFPIRAFTYGENPSQWPDVFRQASLAAEIDGSRVGAEPTRLRFLELRLLEAAAPKAQWLSGEDILASLRIHKDGAEVAAIRRAVDIAQQALNAALPSIRPGVSERELAAELTLQIYRNGSDPELPFAPIVSAGPNSANPHATPTNRLIVPGDLLVIDWGAASEGYLSDLTRTLAIGEIDPRLREVARVVKEANAAGRAAVRPGATASSIDRATRAVIETAGYGQYFIHRTGHGLGLESHEPPYIRSDNDLVLEPGMTFTVEPGIYLPGYNGVRIEDNVVVTEHGCETLSDMMRDLISIGVL